MFEPVSAAYAILYFRCTRGVAHGLGGTRSDLVRFPSARGHGEFGGEPCFRWDGASTKREHTSLECRPLGGEGAASGYPHWIWVL
jgi:hypothetical protein